MSATRFALAGLMVLLAATSISAADPARRMNVLAIVSDDMNTALGTYGHPLVKTPHIDRLAARGMRFDRAYCQVPLCNPSRTSLLAGLRPEKTGVWTLSASARELMPNAVMLPEYFRQQGYFTAQVGKIFHTGEGHEDARSWDVLIKEFGKHPPKEEILREEDINGPRSHTMDWAILKTPDERTPDGIMARKAVEVLQKAAKDDKPFFIATGFRRPHAPFAAPKPYFDLYDADETPLPNVPQGHYEGLLPASLNYGPPKKPLTGKQEREVTAAYYACNSFVDAQVGVLLDAVDRLELWENTVIILLSDHGYHLGEHGLWHKNSLFEGSARVPLILYAPGEAGAGKACRRPVELVDVFPTLTGLCNVPTPGGLDGKSLVPLLKNPEQTWKKAAYTAVARGKTPSKHTKKIKYFGRSVRTDRWRYTEWDGGKKGTELYDYANDPGELVNLVGRPEHATVVTELRALLVKLPFKK